jgi:hypothetical protein
MKGGLVCYYHGGNAPHVKRKATERVHAKEIERHLGLPLDVSPQEALERSVRLAAGDLETLRERVERIERGEYELAAGERLATLTLYTDALDRVARIAKLGVDAGLAERQLAVSETTAAAIVAVLRVALQAAGVAGDGVIVAERAAAAELRRIAATN